MTEHAATKYLKWAAKWDRVIPGERKGREMTDEEQAVVEAEDHHKAALTALMAAEAAEYGAWEAVLRAKDVNKSAQAARRGLGQ